MKISSRREGALAILALVTTAVLWGTNHVAARAIRDTVPLPALAFWRWCLALLVLAPLVGPLIYRERASILPNGKALILLGVIGVGFFSILLYAGSYQSLALEVGLLNATTPVWVLVFAVAMSGKLPKGSQLLGLALASLGTLVALTRGDPAAVLALTPQIGNLWALLAAMTFAGYSMALATYAKDVSVISLTSITAFAGTTVVLLPLYLGWILSGGPALTYEVPEAASGLAALAYIAIGPTLIANMLWVYGTARIGATRAGGFLYISPIASLVLSVLFLGEEFHAFHALAFVLVLSGLGLLNWRPLGLIPGPRMARCAASKPRL